MNIKKNSIPTLLAIAGWITGYGLNIQAQSINSITNNSNNTSSSEARQSYRIFDKVINVERSVLQQTNSTFDHRLFQADEIMRAQDGYTSAKLWSNPCHCFNELDPIAPGPNHAGWMTYAFQATAAVTVAQGYNVLYKHNHKKLARALLIADVISETVAVSNNYRFLNQGALATTGRINNNALTNSRSSQTIKSNPYQHNTR